MPNTRVNLVKVGFFFDWERAGFAGKSRACDRQTEVAEGHPTHPATEARPARGAVLRKGSWDPGHSGPEGSGHPTHFLGGNRGPLETQPLPQECLLVIHKEHFR